MQTNESADEGEEEARLKYKLESVPSCVFRCETSGVQGLCMNIDELGNKRENDADTQCSPLKRFDSSFAVAIRPSQCVCLSVCMNHFVQSEVAPLQL